MYSFKITVILSIVLSSLLHATPNNKKIAYIVSDTSIPYWRILAQGIKNKAKKNGYSLTIYNAQNSKKNELIHTITAIKEDVEGIILSPINSSTATTILKLTQQANIPVIIADVGSDTSQYISYISSNNYQGAYALGKILAKKMRSLQWDTNATVGIIAIPQKRSNGKKRTKGFLKAMHEAKIKGADMRQQVNFSVQETYNFAKELIKRNPKLKALWLQGSDKYQGALDAIKDSGKGGEILLICFDAEPIFLELIPKGILIGSAMQQPYLMGQKALEVMHKHLNGEEVEKHIELKILAISADNIEQMLERIKKNVLGMESE